MKNLLPNSALGWVHTIGIIFLIVIVLLEVLAEKSFFEDILHLESGPTTIAVAVIMVLMIVIPKLLPKKD